MPVYDFSYEWYQQAYSLLRYSKTDNGYIPLSEILAYSEHFELIGSKIEFLKVIRGLDIIENKFYESEELKKEKPAIENNNVNIKR